MHHASNRAGKTEGSGWAPRGLGMPSYLMPLPVRIPHVPQITRTERRGWLCFRSARLLLHFGRGLSSSELLSSVGCVLYGLFRSKREEYWLMGFCGAKMLTGMGAQGLCQSWAYSWHPHTYRRATLHVSLFMALYVKFKTIHLQAQSILRIYTCDHIFGTIFFSFFFPNDLFSSALYYLVIERRC